MEEHLASATRPNRRIALLRAAFAACAPLLVAGCRGFDHPEIRDVLDAQVQAWNAGDIDGFMSHYWKSDQLTFVSTHKEDDPATGTARDVSKTTRGWQATLNRYRRRYPTPEAMGRLTFTHLKIARTDDEAMDLSGRFHLSRQAGPLSGRFFLKMRRINGKWVITRDHTVAD